MSSPCKQKLLNEEVPILISCFWCINHLNKFTIILFYIPFFSKNNLFQIPSTIIKAAKKASITHRLLTNLIHVTIQHPINQHQSHHHT
jgi:hypothetical protein